MDVKPLICETVTGRSMAELLAARDACRDGDMVELRLDGVTDLDVAGALQGRRTKVIVTCRPTWEGGRFDGPEETRRAFLQQAFDLGAEFVDVEFRAQFGDLVSAHRDRVVISSHDFSGVPADIVERSRAMRATGAAVVKVAVMPSGLRDLTVLRDITAEGPAVVIGMGASGLPSRLLPAHFGSTWTYAGHGAAPGQIPARQMIQDYRFRDAHAGTAIYGVVGNNVTHSLSPVMHNAAFAAARIDAVYVPLLPADYADFLAFADAFGVQGASITIPYKLDALHAAGEVDAQARAVGAVNTLRRTGDQFSGINTDVDGFLAPLESLYSRPLKGARAAVLGAGGSARAVVYALRSRGAQVTVHARRQEQARDLAREFDVASGAWPVPARSWDLLINCTPAGSVAAPNESPLPGGPFDGSAVYDLTYRRPHEGESPLLLDARQAGCLTLDGLPMLVSQAEKQFEYWTGVRPEAGVMADAVGRRLAAPALS